MASASYAALSGSSPPLIGDNPVGYGHGALARGRVYLAPITNITPAVWTCHFDMSAGRKVDRALTLIAGQAADGNGSGEEVDYPDRCPEGNVARACKRAVVASAKRLSRRPAQDSRARRREKAERRGTRHCHRADAVAIPPCAAALSAVLAIAHTGR